MDYFLARYYSGPMGRFLSVDPDNAGALLGDPQAWNGYAYVTNRPLTLAAPDGRCPWCIGAVVGAVSDIALQVAVDGKSFSEIDVGSVLISAAAGATGAGVVTKVAKLAKFAKLGAKGEALARGATEVAFDSSVSAVQQHRESGEVSVLKTVADVGVGKLAGGLAGRRAAKSASGSQTVKQLQKEADRKTRIGRKAQGRGDVSSARNRFRQASELTGQADDFVKRRSIAAGVSASSAGSKIGTEAVEFVEKQTQKKEEGGP